MTTDTIQVAGGTVIITVAGGAGSLASTGLKSGDPRWDAGIDGIESLILALAVAGYDLSEPTFQNAIESALGALEKNLS